MTRALPWLVALAGLAASGACEPMYYVSVKAPLIAPVTPECLRRALQAYNGRQVRQAEEPPGERKGYLQRVTLTDGWTRLDQLILMDSSVTLEGSAGRVGRRYTPSERDSLGHRLGRLLLAARDTCAGRSPPGQPEYQLSDRRPQ